VIELSITGYKPNRSPARVGRFEASGEVDRQAGEGDAMTTDG
jgi:hypothetical protein